MSLEFPFHIHKKRLKKEEEEEEGRNRHPINPQPRKKMSNLAAVPGKVPISHTHVSNPMFSERRVRSLELVLRVLICALGSLSVFLIATDTQVRVIFTIQKKAKFTEMKALVYASQETPFFTFQFLGFLFS